MDFRGLGLRHVASRGVATVRHVNGCVVIHHSPDDIVVWAPLGSTVVKWKLETGPQQVHHLVRASAPVCLHRDAVTSLVTIPSNTDNYVLSTSYSGEISIWRVTSDSQWCSVWRTHENDLSLPIMHIDVMDNTIVICSFRRDRDWTRPLDSSSHASLSSWKVLLDEMDNPVALQRLCAARLASEETLPMILSEDTFICATNDLDARFSSTASRLNLFCSNNLEQPATELALLSVSPVSCTKNIVLDLHASSRLLVVSQVDRTLSGFLITEHNGVTKCERKFGQRLQGSGPIFCMSISSTTSRDGLEVFVPEDSGVVSVWRLHCPTDASWSIAKARDLRFTDTSCTVYAIEWISIKKLLISSISRFFVVDAVDHVPTALDFSRPVHDISCCGLAHLPTHFGDVVVVGDLSGNVLFWRVDQHSSDHGEPAGALSHAAAVRCIASFPGRWGENQTEGFILCGLMDGSVHWWHVSSSGPPLFTVLAHQLVQAPQDNVVVTSVDVHPTYPSCFAVADSSGSICVFRQQSDSFVREGTVAQNTQTPHVTSKEVWSVHWHSSGSYLASANEDFSVKVFQFKQGQGLEGPIAVLPGATAATTSVKWSGNNLFASSDDCTIRQWILEPATNSLQLCRVFRTPAAHLMITYIDLFSEANAAVTLCAATMSGHLYPFVVQHDILRLALAWLDLTVLSIADMYLVQMEKS